MPHRPVEILNPVIVGFGMGNEDAGIVHQHIEATEALNGEIHTGARRRFVGHISEINFRLATAGRDGRGHVPHRVGRQAVQNQAGAFTGEFMGDGFPDAGTGTGDDRDLVF